SHVADWKKTIEAWEEEQRVLEIQRQVQEETNRRGWEEYKAGLGLKNKGRYRSAIAHFDRIKEMGATDKTLLARSRRMRNASAAAIAEKRDPILAEAKQAEDGGEHRRAFDYYTQAVKIDPDHREGHRGIRRMRELLRERARVLYAEGVMAESYSDFETAKSRYAEVMSQAPEDDLYYERAQRKLSNY